MRYRTLLAIIVLLETLLMVQETLGTSRPSVQVTIRPVVTGQTYVASLRLVRTPISGRVQFTTVYRVAIFPLADYSYQQSLTSPLSWGGNRRIIEALTDAFLAHGIAVALQDDVDGLLIADGITPPPSHQQAELPISPGEQFQQRVQIANTPEFELVSGLHDDVMRDELDKVVRGQEYLKGSGSVLIRTPGEPMLQGLTSRLPTEKIIDLGRRLDVDLIVRGRIHEYGLNPARPETSVVQVRLYAQETKTGELIWSNRGEVQVSQAADVKFLIDQATQALIDALMDDFFGERLAPAATR
jgi:hypothetical protein